MSDGTHLLIPFASADAQACRQALRTLSLPHLDKLLARLQADTPDTQAADTLSPPHERALARACGLSAPDGQLPWAAWQAAQQAQAPGSQAWAFITPCFWDVAMDHIALADPAQLRLQEAESRALLAAMQPFFAEDGITLAYHAPARWVARGEVFRGLATASLDRVVGRDIDAWIPRMPQAAPLRRLQSEMQMLLYTHALNDARAERGQRPVNSFWVSGTGALPEGAAPLPAGDAPWVCEDLREPALRGDGAAWAQAWQQLDATACARLLQAQGAGRPVTLTLCGERGAQVFHTAPQRMLRRISSVFYRKPSSTLLEQL
jgi:hypothetical protein